MHLIPLGSEIPTREYGGLPSAQGIANMTLFCNGCSLEWMPEGERPCFFSAVLHIGFSFGMSAMMIHLSLVVYVLTHPIEKLSAWLAALTTCSAMAACLGYLASAFAAAIIDTPSAFIDIYHISIMFIALEFLVHLFWILVMIAHIKSDPNEQYTICDVIDQTSFV